MMKWDDAKARHRDLRQKRMEGRVLQSREGSQQPMATSLAKLMVQWLISRSSTDPGWHPRQPTRASRTGWEPHYGCGPCVLGRDDRRRARHTD